MSERPGCCDSVIRAWFIARPEGSFAVASECRSVGGTGRWTPYARMDEDGVEALLDEHWNQATMIRSTYDDSSLESLELFRDDGKLRHYASVIWKSE